MYPIVEDLSPTSKQLTLEIPFAVFSAPLDLIVSEISKKVNFKGFRPGKAPKNLIINKNSTQIVNKLSQTIIADAVEKEIKEMGIYPVTAPVITDYELKDGQPLRLSVTFDYVPEIEIPDLSTIKAFKYKPWVSESMIESQLKHLAKSIASAQDAPPDHVLEPGDRVTFELETLNTDGNTINSKDTTTFDLDGDPLRKKLEEDLIGHKVGDRITIHSTIEEPDANNEPKTKEIIFNLHVIGIMLVTYPPYDDEFAKDLNIPNVNTFDELKEFIRKRLFYIQESDSEDRLFEQITSQLYKACTVHIPDSYLETEIDRIIAQKRKALEKNRKNELRETLETWLKNQKLRDNVRKQATYNAAIGLIFSQITRNNNINVTPDEINAAIKNDYAEYDPKGIEKLKDQPHSYYNIYKNSLLSRKTQKFIESQIDLTIVTPPKDEPDDQEAAGQVEPSAQEGLSAAPETSPEAGPESGPEAGQAVALEAGPEPGGQTDNGQPTGSNHGQSE
jgi:trigger factor